MEKFLKSKALQYLDVSQEDIDFIKNLRENKFQKKIKLNQYDFKNHQILQQEVQLLEDVDEVYGPEQFNNTALSIINRIRLLMQEHN